MMNVKENCGNCNKEFILHDSKAKEHSKSGLVFCSRSCSAIFNNKLYPKRIKKEKIKKPPKIKKEKNYKEKKNWNLITYADMLFIYKKKYKVNSKIRNLAKTIYKNSSKPKYCINCKYDIFYEVCHIKPICSFLENTPISVINNLDNLVSFCPNCHWEFDNGEIKL
jgi:hypothetical protein